MATRKLEVVITGDATQLEKSLGRVSDQASGFGDKMKKAALPAAAALGAVAVGAKKTVDAASNLDEQINKTSVVFGDNGKEIQQWSQGLTKNFGMSQRAALEAAGTYGNMLKPMGILPEKTKEISTRMVELAGDMASFNNASPEETLDALRAGLAGETEPLRRFGVFLNEATVQAEAMSSGIVKTTKDLTAIKAAQLNAADAMDRYTKAQKEHGVSSEEAERAAIALEVAEDKLSKAVAGKVPKLTAAEKALATYNIITKSTADAQGDFARTSDSVANQQRIQAAETENLNAKIGKGLLPVYQTLQKMLLEVTGFLSEHTTVTKIAAAVVATLAVSVLAVNAAMATQVVVVPAAKAAWAALNLVMAGNPIALVVIALAALAAGIILAYKKSETFREIVDEVWSSLKRMGGWIVSNWDTISNIIEKAPMILVLKTMVTHVDDLWNSFVRLGGWINEQWDRAVDKVSSAGLITFLKGAVKAIDDVVDAFKSMVDWIRDAYNWLKKLGDLPGVGLLGRLTGDARDPTFVPPSIGTAGAVVGASRGIDLRGANPEMMPFAVAAQGLGLSVTSGLRPGAITANGTLSDHARGKALDVAGSAFAMGAFFDSLIGNRSVKQAFYDPKGSIFGGLWNSYREGGHNDHVHVATYDKGGLLRPGWTMAYNGTGRNEYVSRGAGGIVININAPQVNPRETARQIRDELRALDRVETGGSRPALT